MSHWGPLKVRNHHFLHHPVAEVKVSPGTTSRVHAALPQAPPATLSASVADPVARDCGSGLHRPGALQRTYSYRVVVAAAPWGQRSASFLFCSRLLCGLLV